MARDPRFDLLFEPVPIGPVVAPNRFYQVPHCTGMGYRRPRTLAGLREVKAEGGWGTVCTEYCSIHPSSDDEPYPSASLWDDDDLRALALTVEKVHAHGALAGVELWHGGSSSANHYSREVPLGTWSRPAGRHDPVQTAAMDRDDIRRFKRWHVDAARRAQGAGFDIVYVYAAHGYLVHQFLHPSNRRDDGYGGSLTDRTRLLRELVEETKEAVGDTCAVAVRFSVGPDRAGARTDEAARDARATLELMADLPDLWDVTVDDYGVEMGTSRFVPEAALEHAVAWVKDVTSRPVVSVGRFTSPETMLRLVRQGVVDLIGAARPSIADPFLPRKIAEGRDDEIRECIGCNICYAGDSTGVPIRCTQNPTIGEEWRKGWHPERIPPRGSDSSVLIVGGGPAGMEAAVALGTRGYDVTLVDERTELGGRVAAEATLPGLAAWSRVRDWRLARLARLPNVEVVVGSLVDEAQIVEFGADRVAIATGSTWRRDGTGRWHTEPVPGSDSPTVLTPDDVMRGARPTGPVVVFDDDHYYLGGVVAEALRRAGCTVTLVTPANQVSAWTTRTDEQFQIQRRLVELGVVLTTGTALTRIDGDVASLECIYTGRSSEVAAAAVVMVTSRCPQDALYHALADRIAVDRIAVDRIGDCHAPGTIATAVYSGHRYARELDADGPVDVAFARE